MTLERVRRILCENDGSLPDLTFEFNGAAVVDAAYALIRARATANRMGPEWDEAAIVGLFEIMRDLDALAPAVEIIHDENIYDDADILLGTYRDWLRDAH